jgi:hypothetical protein
MAPQRSTSTPLTRRSLLVAGSAAVLIGAAGCGRQDATASSDPTGRATTAGEDDEKPTRPLTVAQTDSQLRATIDSRKKLDDHPLYSLTWEGQPAKITPPEDAAAGGVLTGFACTLFAASTPDGAALVARNFDWDPAPASVVESTLSTGRKTLSVTDLRYAGIESDADFEDAAKRKGLGRIEAYSFDGINDAGVFIGLAADYEAEPSVKDGREWIGGLSIQRMILDHADDLEDALDIFDSYNVDFTGGPGLHYLIADRSGAKAVVEFDAGELEVIRPPRKQSWMCLENFHMSTVPEAGCSSHWRYTSCADTLESADGRISVDDALNLLDDVRQSNTQWQSVYNLGEMDLRVVGKSKHDYSLSA